MPNISIAQIFLELVLGIEADSNAQTSDSSPRQPWCSREWQGMTSLDTPPWDPHAPLEKLGLTSAEHERLRSFYEHFFSQPDYASRDGAGEGPWRRLQEVGCRVTDDA